MSDDTMSVSPEAIAAIGTRKGGRPKGSGVAGREAAKAAREAELRPEVRESAPRLQRRRKKTEDRLRIPMEAIPPGVSYEWKRAAVFGKPDTVNMNELRENHWTPVPKDRHPNISVEMDGLVLCERPAYLTAEARAEDLAIARGEVLRATNSMRDTPQGQFTREHQSVNRIAKIQTSYIDGIAGPQLSEVPVAEE